MLAILLFGIPAAIIANVKGFKPWWWLLAFGVIGLIVVACLPSAKAAGLSEEVSAARAGSANGIGMVMGALCAGLLVLAFLFGVISIAAS